MIANQYYGGGSATTYINPPCIIRYSELIETSTSSMTASVQAESGEIILAAVNFRDANTLATPEGWTKLIESEDFVDPTGDHVKLALFKKVCTTSETVSVTFNTTTAKYGQIRLLVVKGASDIIYDSNYDLYHTGTRTTPQFVNLPLKSSSDEFIIFTTTCRYWDTASTHGLWTIEGNKLYTIQDSVLCPRMIFIDNILGTDQYKIKYTTLTTDNNYVILGVKLLTE